MRKKFLAITFFIFQFYLLYSESVKINIIGYPKLDSFKIILNEKSDFFLNKNKTAVKDFMVFPKEQKIKIGDNFILIENISIKNNGGINIFESFAGEQPYKGNFFISKSNDTISIINEVDIDDYFASVLGSEMGGGFSLEALKASAVAIRTYYYKKRQTYKDTNFDINNADGIDMVYRGSFYASKKMYRVFKETENLFLVNKEDELVLPLFHSTSAGIILKDQVMSSRINDTIDDPILTYDTDEKGHILSESSPFFKFSININEEDMRKIISSEIKIQKIIEIKLKYFKNTKIIDFIGFYDGSEIQWLKAYKFVSLAQRNGFNGLRSINFGLDKIGEVFYFKGLGFGHFCGMSQYSAETLAKKGLKYDEILKKYYPEYNIKRIEQKKSPIAEIGDSLIHRIKKLFF